MPASDENGPRGSFVYRHHGPMSEPAKWMMAQLEAFARHHSFMMRARQKTSSSGLRVFKFSIPDLAHHFLILQKPGEAICSIQIKQHAEGEPIVREHFELDASAPEAEKNAAPSNQGFSPANHAGAMNGQ